MSKVLSILEALIANGISAEDIKDAANELKAGKAKKGKKPSVADMLEDLSDDELRELVVELDLMKEKAAKKAKRKDLEKALAKADPEELEDAIAELAEDDEDEDDEDDEDDDEDDEPDYEDMSHKELVALVVKRGLAKKAKATKMDEDELIELLEEDDE